MHLIRAALGIVTVVAKKEHGIRESSNLTRVCFSVPPEQSTLRRGQIADGTSFGTALASLAKRSDVKRVLELGTWYGGGSTVHLANAVRDSAEKTLAGALGTVGDQRNCVERPLHGRLHSVEEREGEKIAGDVLLRCCYSLVVTLEVYRPAWRHARLYLRHLPVWPILGSTVGAEEMLQPDEIPKREKTNHFKLYYARDRNVMRNATPRLLQLCARFFFELVLIDGNEYTGWAEFLHIRGKCRPRYIALHDTNTLKTRRAESYLRRAKEYVLLLEKHHTSAGQPGCELVGCRTESSFTPNAAGWSIYRRVTER